MIDEALEFEPGDLETMKLYDSLVPVSTRITALRSRLEQHTSMRSKAKTPGQLAEYDAKIDMVQDELDRLG